MYMMETRGDYTNLKILGIGTKGEITKKVRNLIDQKLYVIKQLGTQKLFDSQKEILKLLEENKCQFIVKHYSNDDRDDEIKTEFIENGDLHDYMTTNMDLEEPIEEKFLWKIFYQCLESVNYLHKNNIIHRNIRLENFYVTDDMDIKLGNFRYSTFKNNLEEAMYYPEDGMFYKNDDALNNNIYNEYSDLYALGVVFYQLCFYEFPFDIIEQEGKYELKRNPEKKTDYSNDIINFINQLLTGQKSNIKELYDIVVHKFIETNISENMIESALRCFCSFRAFTDVLTEGNKSDPKYNEKYSNFETTSNIIKSCIYFRFKEIIGDKKTSNYEDYIDEIKKLFVKNFEIKNGQAPKIIDMIQFIFEKYKQEVGNELSDQEKIVIIKHKLCKIKRIIEISDISSMLKDLKFNYKKIPRYFVISLIKNNQYQLDSKMKFLTKFKDEETNENYILAGYIIKKIIEGKEKYIPIYLRQIKNELEYRSSEGKKIQKIDEQNLFDNSEGTIEVIFYKRVIPK